jgi:hypothetical protein
MKRLFRNKKTLKNLLIGLAVIAVLYYLIGGAEGFQGRPTTRGTPQQGTTNAVNATRNSDGYIYANTSQTNAAPLKIPASLFSGKSSGIFKFEKHTTGGNYVPHTITSWGNTGVKINVGDPLLPGVRINTNAGPIDLTSKKDVYIQNLNTATLNMGTGNTNDPTKNNANFRVMIQ